jgi:exo-1,4-beta-D-glucosaminidase
MISLSAYNDEHWYPIHRMPATVLQILQEDGVYPDLYVGKNLREKVPQDLYKQDWWYRVTFKAPASDFYTLEFPGINYRAEIWINGEKIADNKQVVGMYVAHEFNVTQWIKKDSENVLAVRVTPEQKIQNVNGVELADSWFDWINWKYLGYMLRRMMAMDLLLLCSGQECRHLKPVVTIDRQRFNQSRTC